jgi:hypothetical protein
MKSLRLMTGMLLMLLIAGNTSLNAQRGMRGGMDSTRMNRPGRDMGLRQMRSPGQKGDSLNMIRMHQRFTPVPGHNTIRGMGSGRDAMRGMVPCYQYGMNRQARFGMRGMGPAPEFQMGIRPYRPEKNMIGVIPNLTDKQKTEIAALRQQQRNEMKKFNEEISGKIQTMREEHRKEIMGLLSDEQKKLVEQASDNKIRSLRR